MNFNSEKIKNYILAYFFIAPVTIFLPNRQLLFSSIFIVSFLIFLFYKKKIDITLLIFITLNLVMLLLQTYYFQRFSLSSTIRLFMNILLPYFLMKTIGRSYIDYFIKIVYFFTIVSFLFYFPSLISDTVHTKIGMIAPSLGTDSYLSDQNFIIYTWENKHNNMLRNSGNFTEPGYFAAILSLAFSVNLLKDKNLFSKKNLVFIVGLLTTLSTAGYISLFYILTLHTTFIEKKRFKYILIPIGIIGSYVAYEKLDFLQNKINEQYSIQVEEGLEVGRFGSTLSDIKEIKKYPLIGRGITKSTRFDEVDYWEGDKAPRPILNGVTDTILKYGIFGSLIYFFLLIRSINFYFKINKFEKKGIFILLGSIFIVTFSQPILLTPIFLSLLYYYDFKFVNNVETYRNYS